MGKETRLFRGEERKNQAEVGECFHQIAEKLVSGKEVLLPAIPGRKQKKKQVEVFAKIIMEKDGEEMPKEQEGLIFP